MSDIDPADFVHVDEEGDVETDYEGLLARMTGTDEKDWEEVDGPDSGVGDDSWFVNDLDGLRGRVNNDQGLVTVSVHGEDDQDGDDPVESLTFEMDDIV